MGEIVSSLLIGAAGLALLLLLRLVVRRTRGSQAQRTDEVFPSADSASDAPSADQVLFDGARRLLDAQVATNDVLDGRLMTLLGVGTTVLPVTIGLLNLVANRASLSTTTEWLLQLALGAYGALIVSVVVAIRIRNVEFRPNIETLKRHADRGVEGAGLRRWVAEEYVLSIEVNRTRLLWKSRTVAATTIALAVEALLLAFAAFVTVR